MIACRTALDSAIKALVDQESRFEAGHVFECLTSESLKKEVKDMQRYMHELKVWASAVDARLVRMMSFYDEFFFSNVVVFLVDCCTLCIGACRLVYRAFNANDTLSDLRRHTRAHQ